MKNLLLVTISLTLFLACGEPKKQDPKKPDTAAGKAPLDEPDSPATSLDELVYSAEGRVALVSESVARSQGELKGRAGLVRQLEADAISLISGFMPAHRDLMTHDANDDRWKNGLHEYFNSQKLVLRGSAASEYEQSEKGDSLFVTMELPLMNGYEAIETAIINVGKNSKLLQPNRVEDFKKAFQEYYLTEKKKLLTMPS